MTLTPRRAFLALCVVLTACGGPAPGADLGEGEDPLARLGLWAETPAAVPTLHWLAVDGAATYDVQRDGVKISSVVTPGFVDRTAQPGQLYAYQVIARGAGGAVLGQSRVVEVETTGSPAPAPAAVTGTWALQQVNSLQDLRNRRAAIARALATPQLRGFSLRVPWSAIETDAALSALLDEGRAMAEEAGVAFSVRFMAGRWTPASVFAQGAYFYTLPSGEKVPKPFSDAGVAGNPVFERAFSQTVAKLAAYAAQHRIGLLHLPWYGQKWAEVDNGPEVTKTKGYSWSAWLEGHNRLVDLGLQQAVNGLAIEFPLSGHWTQPNGGAALVAHMVEVAGEQSPRIYVQGNGLGVYNGKPTSKLMHGMQLYDGGSYDWRQLYDHLLSAPRASYVEVYVDSWGQAGSAQLIEQVARFAAAK